MRHNLGGLLFTLLRLVCPRQQDFICSDTTTVIPGPKAAAVQVEQADKHFLIPLQPKQPGGGLGVKGLNCHY